MGQGWEVGDLNKLSGEQANEKEYLALADTLGVQWFVILVTKSVA